MITLKDVVTASPGLVAMALGLWNTWQAARKDRVKLRVMPAATWLVSQNEVFHIQDAAKVRDEVARRHMLPLLSIEVTNMSTFAVVLEEVGLRESDLTTRSPFVNPICATENRLPMRLEARSSVTYSGRSQYVDYAFTKQTEVYAKTQCGHTAHQGGPLFTSIGEVIRKIRGNPREPLGAPGLP